MLLQAGMLPRVGHVQILYLMLLVLLGSRQLLGVPSLAELELLCVVVCCRGSRVGNTTGLSVVRSGMLPGVGACREGVGQSQSAVAPSGAMLVGSPAADVAPPGSVRRPYGGVSFPDVVGLCPADVAYPGSG